MTPNQRAIEIDKYNLLRSLDFNKYGIESLDRYTEAIQLEEKIRVISLLEKVLRENIKDEDLLKKLVEEISK